MRKMAKSGHQDPFKRPILARNLAAPIRGPVSTANETRGVAESLIFGAEVDGKHQKSRFVQSQNIDFLDP